MLKGKGRKSLVPTEAQGVLQAVEGTRTATRGSARNRSTGAGARETAAKQAIRHSSLATLLRENS